MLTLIGILAQVWGKYMITKYLDPQHSRTLGAPMGVGINGGPLQCRSNITGLANERPSSPSISLRTEQQPEYHCELNSSVTVRLD